MSQQSLWKEFRVNPAKTSPEFVAPAAPAKTKRRGNPNWGKMATPESRLLADTPTAFERFVAECQIPEASWTRSARVREWVRKNWRQRYVPESLLEAMGLDGDKLPASFFRDDSREALTQ